jgi:acetoin utilization protein AcuB
MRVKQRMTTSPITATPETTYSQARRLMKENAIQHLPILDKKGKLVGVVSHSDMATATPSPVTTLSIYEITDLLDRVTLDEIMSKPALAVEEDCTLPAAAHFMVENDIGCLPVMRGEKLVGIITDTDIFKTFVEVTGGAVPGSRVTVRMPDEPGKVAPILTAFANAGSYIVSVTLTYDEPGYADADVKERGGSEKAIREEMAKLGEGAKILEFRPSDEDRLLKFG